MGVATRRKPREKNISRSTINIAFDKELWQKLRIVGYRLSLRNKRRFPTVRVLMMAVQVFLRLRPEEINPIQDREEYDWKNF